MPKLQCGSPIEPGKDLTRHLTKPSQFVPIHGRGKLNSGGTPGHRGGTGRPSDKLKAFWASVLNGEVSRGEVRKVLENADHPAFVALYSKIALHLVGAPGGRQESGEEDEIWIALDGI